MDYLSEAFETLKKEGKNHLNGIIEKLENADIIDRPNSAKLRKQFSSASQSDMRFNEFKAIVDKVAVEHKKSVDQISRALTGKINELEKTYIKMQKEGKTSADNIIAMMKDSKIIDGVNLTEQRARKMFENADKKKVELEEFTKAMEKVAVEQKKSVEEISKKLEKEIPKLTDAIEAGISAFKNAYSKK